MSRYDFVFDGDRTFRVVDTHIKNSQKFNAERVVYTIDFKTDPEFQLIDKEEFTFSYVDHLRMFVRMYNREHELYTNEIMKFVK